MSALSSYFFTFPRSWIHFILHPVVLSLELEATKQKVEALGKGEFVDLLASKSDVSKKDISAVLDAMREVLASEVLGKGHEVRLRDMGTFKKKVSAPRVGRNPQTGEELQIKGSSSIGFSAATGMIDRFTNLSCSLFCRFVDSSVILSHWNFSSFNSHEDQA